MTISFVMNLRYWATKHSKQLSNAHSVDDVKRIYKETMYPDGKITTAQREVLLKVPWDKVYRWVEGDRADRGQML